MNVPLTDFNGVAISRLGIGCSNFGKRCDGATAEQIVRTALDAGINFFDIADVYGGGTAEELLARGLNGRRSEAVIATKFGHATKEFRHPHERGGHPENVRRSAEASLRALRTDYIDLYQIHEPDPAVPVQDTLGALHSLIKEGKVRWAGCCNFSLEQIVAAQNAAATGGVPGFLTAQNEYSLLVRDVERDILPHCRETDMRFIPYFPLASGVLTGKYRMDARIPAGSRVAQMKPDKLFRFFTSKALELVEDLVRYGDRRGLTPLELAMGFHLADDTILSVIAGAMSADQVRANAAAATAVLTDEDIDFLRGLPWAPGG